MSEEVKSIAFAKLVHCQEVEAAQERTTKRAKRDAEEFQQWAATHPAQMGENQEELLTKRSTHGSVHSISPLFCAF